MLQIQQGWALKGIKKQLFMLNVVIEVGALDGCTVINNMAEGTRQEDISVEFQRLKKTGVCLELEIFLWKMNFTCVSNEGESWKYCTNTSEKDSIYLTAILFTDSMH